MNKELKPCPFCGKYPDVSWLGTFIDFDCCCSMSFQKSEYLTIAERETWNKETALFSNEVESKVFAEVANIWNNRAYETEIENGAVEDFVNFMLNKWQYDLRHQYSQWVTSRKEHE